MLMTLEEIKEHLQKLHPYLSKKGGGVTLSGGEPALQPDFAAGIFRLARSLKLTTALDTNGSCPQAKIGKLLKETDIVLLDIKASTDKLHRKITGKPLAPARVCTVSKAILFLPMISENKPMTSNHLAI